MKKNIFLFALALSLASSFFSSCEKKEDEGITVTYASDAGSGNNPNRRETKQDNKQNSAPEKQEVKK